MVGNFIADTLKGESLESYPPKVQTGILIHRHIDMFTDENECVLEVRKILYPYFSKYAGVVQDVYFDHFLAANWSSYSTTNLKEFTKQVYATLNANKEIMNSLGQRVLYYMHKQDWLYNYRNVEGIDKALKGLSSRASFVSNMEYAVPPLLKHFDKMYELFQDFWPALDGSVRNTYKVELNSLIETN